MSRFKIDFNPGYSRYSSFILAYRVPTLYGIKWECIDTFDSIEKAKEHYEKIKDLPEYLP